MQERYKNDIIWRTNEKVLKQGRQVYIDAKRPKLAASSSFWWRRHINQTSKNVKLSCLHFQLQPTTYDDKSPTMIIKPPIAKSMLGKACAHFQCSNRPLPYKMWFAIRNHIFDKMFPRPFLAPPLPPLPNDAGIGDQFLLHPYQVCQYKYIQKMTRYNEYQQEIDTKEDKIMNLQSCVAFGRAI